MDRIAEEIEEYKRMKIESIKKKLKIKKLNLLRRFFGVHSYNTLIQLNDEFVDWFFEMNSKFTELELYAIKEFAEENKDKLPKQFIYEINLAFESIIIEKEIKKWRKN